MYNICDFNHLIEQIRVFFKNLTETKIKDRSAIDIKLKECRLSLDRLTLDPINRYENVTEIVNIIKNLFDTLKRPKQLKNIGLLPVCVLKRYTNSILKNVQCLDPLKLSSNEQLRY